MAKIIDGELIEDDLLTTLDEDLAWLEDEFADEDWYDYDTDDWDEDDWDSGFENELDNLDWEIDNEDDEV